MYTKGIILKGVHYQGNKSLATRMRGGHKTYDRIHVKGCPLPVKWELCYQDKRSALSI